MGQARRRGTYEERRARAVAKKRAEPALLVEETKRECFEPNAANLAIAALFAAMGAGPSYRRRR